MFHPASLFRSSLLALHAFGGFALAAEQIDLSPDPQVVTSRVLVNLTAGGQTLVRTAADDGKDEATEQKLPMSVAATLDYDERRLPTTKAPNSPIIQAVRYYNEAEAVLKVGESGRTPKLADNHRLIAMVRDEDRPRFYSPEGPLTREQLDLIDVVGSSLYIQQLLPEKSVTDGDTWNHDANLMRGFLALDSVAVCEVQSVLEEHNTRFAKIRLAGVVHGLTDGAATELEIRALYLFDRRARRITKLNLAVKESRSIGGATPGLDAVAKVQMKIESIESSPEITDAIVAELTSAPPIRSQDVLYEAPPLGFRFQHDRNWFVASERREAVSMRRVDQGDLVAHCTITSLPPKSAGRQVSLEQFQKDVTFSLGKSFGELVSSRQWQNAAGHYCYELVVRGLVENVPIEWHYFLVAPESGHRVSVAVTIEKPMVERLGNVDRDLVESLELFPRMPAAQTAAQPNSEAVKK